MTTWRTGLAITTTVFCGLWAGIIYAFATNIMPALDKLDDRAAVEAMQQMNEVGPLFVLIFLAAPLLAIATAATMLGSPVRRWLIVAAVLSVAAALVTIAFNIPLNDDLKSVGDTADARQAWDDFYGDWIAWNWVRALLQTGAFAAMAGALVGIRRDAVR